jgi:hypothetical protein
MGSGIEWQATEWGDDTCSSLLLMMRNDVATIAIDFRGWVTACIIADAVIHH